MPRGIISFIDVQKDSSGGHISLETRSNILHQSNKLVSRRATRDKTKLLIWNQGVDEDKSLQFLQYDFIVDLP
jgi:hypothetical protein